MPNTFKQNFSKLHYKGGFGRWQNCSAAIPFHNQNCSAAIQHGSLLTGSNFPAGKAKQRGNINMEVRLHTTLHKMGPPSTLRQQALQLQQGTTAIQFLLKGELYSNSL